MSAFGSRQVLRRRLRTEWEAWVVVLLAGVWYGTNVEGGIFMDGAIFARASRAMLDGYMYGNPTHAHAPVAKYFLAFSQAAFGSTEFGVKLPSVVSALATVYTTYRLGRFLFSRPVGLLAAVILAGNPLFVRWTATAYLDITFTFVVTLLVYALVRWESAPTRVLGLAVGALIVTTAATKLQGAVFALAGGIGVVYGLRVHASDRTEAVAALRPPVVGAVVALAVIYVPFLFSPHPEYYAGTDLPAVVDAAFRLPLVGNVVYAFGESFAHNFGHISAGHQVTVAGETYVDPPFWSYLYWMATRGGAVPLLGLVGAGYLLVAGYVHSDPPLDRSRAVAVAVSAFVPLVLVSAISVKNPKYVLPLYPLLIAVSVASLGNALGWLLARLPAVDVPRRRAVSLGLVFALVVSVPLASGSGTFTESPRSDSQYDDATAFLVDRATDRTADRSMRVVAGVPLPIRWYLGDTRTGNFSFESEASKPYDVDHDGTADVVLSGIGFGNATVANRVRETFQEGQVCYAVDISGPSVSHDGKIAEWLDSNGTIVATYPRTHKGAELTVSRFEAAC